MSGSFGPPPTVAGFGLFITNQMQIPTAALPSNSEWIGWAFDQAMAIVNCDINCASPLMYTLAVYNLAGDTLINICPDVANCVPVVPAGGSDSCAGMCYFAYQRAKMNITGFLAGVVGGSGDETTNQSLVVPEAFNNFLIGDLQNLKTPWGRAYLAIAQKYGSLWGAT